MLKDIREKRLQRSVIMFWDNKREEDIICRKELDDMVSEDPNLEIIHILSRQEDWAGEKGHIDAEKLKRYRTRLQNIQCFVCGPPALLKDVRKAFRSLGVHRKRVHWERFILR